MTTSKTTHHASHKNAAKTEVVAETTTPAAPPPLPVSIAATPPAPSGASVSPSVATSLAMFIAPPPTNAFIPPVPANYIADSGTTYRGTTPAKAELVALPLAVADLEKFAATYAAVFGSTALPYDEILQLFTVANLWSSMRTASGAWDGYCRDQEGVCWVNMRLAMERLQPAFALAVKANPSIATAFAGLAALLGVKAGIAKKGATTRRLNRAAVAKGEPPTHGAIGKRRKKANEKLAATPPANAPTPTTTGQVAPPAPQPTPTLVTPGPVATPLPVNVAPASPLAATVTLPASTTALPVTNGVNGAGH